MKRINKLKECLAVLKRSRGVFLTALCSFIVLPATPVLAAEQITSKINNIYSLVTGIIAAIGAIVIAWGVFDFAMSYQQHDSSQQTVALKRIVSGLLMLFVGGIIALLT